VLQREEIYQRVWGYAMVHGDRSVDVFVRKLRQKLEKVSPDWRYIHTHFGIGYRFASEPADAVPEDALAAEVAAVPPTTAAAEPAVPGVEAGARGRAAAQPSAATADAAAGGVPVAVPAGTGR